MKYLFTILFSVVYCAVLFSQSTLVRNQVSGIVRDDFSAVQNVYIFLKNYPDFNCLSDSEGGFKLRFPENLKNDTIVVSHLGYTKIEVPLNNLNGSTNILNLKEKTIGLDEIVVEPEENSLREMLQKVVLRIPGNYPERRHQLTGLFRKVSTNYDEFTQLVEAQVVVEDVGYNKDVKRAKIEISNLRKSDDFSEMDSTYILFLRKFRDSQSFGNQDIESDNQTIQLFESNLLRKNYIEKSPLNINGFSNEFFGVIEKPVYQKFVGYDIIDQDTIYTISYGTTDPPIGTTYIKVNSRDFAVLEFQVTRYMDADRELYEQFFMKYRKFNGKYFPEKLVHKVMRFINRDVGGHQMDIQTFYFDSVKTDKLDKIHNSEREKRDQKIDLESHVYDSAFWRTSEHIKKHPLDSAIIKSLERSKSLEEQFRSNGKN